MTSVAPGADRTTRRAGAILALLLAINLLNYIDRQVLATVESQIQRDLLPGTPEADVQFWMGLLQTAFLVSYLLIAPLFGWLADRINRWWIIGGGVIVWSLASGASGLATSYSALLLTRVLIGIGEAAYGPAAPTLLSDLFPVARRGRVLSLFYVAIPVGSALGYALGGVMEDLWGWRSAFYVSMPPGIALGLACLWLRDQRQPTSAGNSRHDPPAHSWAAYLRLMKTRSYVLNTLAMTAMTFALGAVAWWMPRYIRDFRHEGSSSSVGLTFGAITVVAGIAATLSGGWLGDKLRRRWPGSYFLVSGFGMLVGTPLFLAVLKTPFPAAWVLIFLAEFCLFLNTGPANAALANVTRPEIRSSAFAINIFLIHLLGDAISPPLVGKINGWYHGDMDVGFAAVSGAIALSGIFWIAGARFLGHDTEVASAGDCAAA